MSHFGVSFPANQTTAIQVLSAEVETYNGRSQFYWFQLDTGDLVLGVYPQGNTYMDIEEAVQKDLESAVLGDTIEELETEDE